MSGNTSATRTSVSTGHARSKSWWSRPGAVLAFIIGAASYLVVSPRRLLSAFRPSLIGIGFAIAIIALSIAVNPARIANTQTGRSPLGFLSQQRLDPDGPTITDRETQDATALSLFKKAPVLGHGLGYFLATTGSTLHNSLLWLLIETGLLGAIAFTGFLLAALYVLYLGRDDSFLLGMFAVSIAFMVISITGEFLYQRHLWLLLGMALAAPLTVGEQT